MAMLLRAHIETNQAEVRKITLHQVHLARQGGAAKQGLGDAGHDQPREPQVGRYSRPADMCQDTCLTKRRNRFSADAPSDLFFNCGRQFSEFPYDHRLQR